MNEMMGDVNKITLIGTITSIEVAKTNSNKTVTNVIMITKSVYGENKVSTCDHKIVLWGQPAEFAAKYAKKGSRAYVDGEMRNRDWVNKEGIKMYSKEVAAKEFKLLDDKGLQEEKKSLNY